MREAVRWSPLPARNRPATVARDRNRRRAQFSNWPASCPRRCWRALERAAQHFRWAKNRSSGRHLPLECLRCLPRTESWERASRWSRRARKHVRSALRSARRAQERSLIRLAHCDPLPSILRCLADPSATSRRSRASCATPFCAVAVCSGVACDRALRLHVSGCV